MSRMNEDCLVQRTTADYLHDVLGWDSVYAYNQETFGPDGLLGRISDREVILARYLRQKLEEFNPGLPPDAYIDAVRQIAGAGISQTLLAANREKHELMKTGVQVSYRNAQGELKKERLRVFNFDEPEKNHFLCVRELWIRGDLYRRRADIIGFVNGIPLLFIECKNVHKSIRTAFEKNLSDYKDTIPHLFTHNAVILLANGLKAKIGSISAKYGHYNNWKRLSEGELGIVSMETLLKGVCDKRNFLDLFENFIIFDESFGTLAKIIAKNHQFLGVNKAFDAVIHRKERAGKLGVFWHTQGAGKSYSMAFFTRKVHRRLGGNFTFLICTDRDDLDTQIYKTFAGCGLADNEKVPCRPKDGAELKAFLGQHKPYVFTLVQKFNQDVLPEAGYSLRDDIVVITDEAHRTQYGRLSLNMRNALPNASYIGFTGTPLFTDDEITMRVFGDYISTYDFKRAVDDNATVPLYYDARGEKLGIATIDLNQRIAEKLEEIETEDVDVQQRLERDLARDYHIITAQKRLEQIAHDFVKHYSNGWLADPRYLDNKENSGDTSEPGKAMLVCIDKLTCVRMHALISEYWKAHIKEFEEKLPKIEDDQELQLARRHLEWLQETQIAVVVSEEQGEVDKFRKWGLDILPHRRLIKNGIEIPAKLRAKPEFANISCLDIDSAFKEPEHPFRIAIVCAMWLTGFDVPSLSNLYLDKPLKAHTLMQAIARANRVYEGKNNGLILDYCGILKNLRKALATFAGKGGTGGGGDGKETDPTKPEEQLLKELEETISFVEAFLKGKGASLDNIIWNKSFARNAAILAAKEAANENDETRKHFEIMCREVFKKFKACINLRIINSYLNQYDAINIIYRSLQKDREQTDITDIIRALHLLVDEAIETKPAPAGDSGNIYNIANIDFDRLRKEFQKSKAKHTTVQNLKAVIDNRLEKLLLRNPMRTDLHKRYEEIVADYNSEKDRKVIEQTFEALLLFVQALDKEETRAITEGLDEESLAIFDLLKKPVLTAAEAKRIKKVAVDLLGTLKAEKLKIDHWREKESTRDSVRNAIQDFLWRDESGLPTATYSEADVKQKTEDIYQHVYRAYPTLPSPYYQQSGM